MRAQVIVLAGPSGAGKSRLAERVGLPVLRLDDFYKDDGDPTLPRISAGPNAGLVDWDHTASWQPEEAVATLEELATTGRAEVPIYDISRSGHCGTRTLDLAGATHFVAEGIFAQDVVAACRERHLLAAAYCITQHPAITFWRRLTRDLRERRKPPAVLLRRGIALAREQRHVVADAVAKGCRRSTSEGALREIRARLDGHVQPDSTACGSSTLVMARMLNDPAHAMFMRTGHDPATGQHDGLTEAERFAQQSLDMHDHTNGFRQSGGLRMPWPKALGTSPGGLVNEMNNGHSGVPGTTYRMKYADPGSPGALYDDVLAASNAGHPVPIYVGNRLSPRHVLLVTGTDGDDLTVYNPADGGTHTITRWEWESGRLRDKASWDEPWGAVVPR